MQDNNFMKAKEKAAGILGIFSVFMLIIALIIFGLANKEFSFAELIFKKQKFSNKTI